MSASLSADIVEVIIQGVVSAAGSIGLRATWLLRLGLEPNFPIGLLLLRTLDDTGPFYLIHGRGGRRRDLKASLALVKPLTALRVPSL